MMRRLVTIFIIVPLAAVLIALAVANRGPVDFTFDPFNPGNPLMSVRLPLFIYIFAAMAVGLVLGSLATWFGQGRYRREAREKAAEVRKLAGAADMQRAQSLALTRG